MYDERCWELATFFLSDAKTDDELLNEARQHLLAQEIQTTIEDFMGHDESGRAWRCKRCETLWHMNPPSEAQPHGSWSLFPPEQQPFPDRAPGKCCDNAADFLAKIEPVS